MLAYFTDPSKWATGVAGSPTQMADAEGHISIVNSEVSDNAQWHVAVPTDHCAGVTDAQRYNAQSNPGGVPCEIQDAAINVFGPKPPACAPGFVAGSSLGPVRLSMTRARPAVSSPATRPGAGTTWTSSAHGFS